MNNKKTTPPVSKGFIYQVVFPVEGHLALIQALPSLGIEVKTDQRLTRACASFESIKERDAFKEKLMRVSV